MTFVPAVVAAPTVAPCRAPTRRSRRSRQRSPAAGIELEVAEVLVRVGPGGSAAQIAAVIGALKATA